MSRSVTLAVERLHEESFPQKTGPLQRTEELHSAAVERRRSNLSGLRAVTSPGASLTSP